MSFTFFSSSKTLVNLGVRTPVFLMKSRIVTMTLSRHMMINTRFSRSNIVLHPFGFNRLTVSADYSRVLKDLSSYSPFPFESYCLPRAYLTYAPRHGGVWAFASHCQKHYCFSKSPYQFFGLNLKTDQPARTYPRAF